MNWGQIQDNAMDKPCGNYNIKTMDKARWEIENLIMEILGYDVSESKYEAEEIEYYAEKWDIQFNREGKIKRYRLPIGA